MLKTAPAVFAVGNDYEIMVPVDSETLFYVRVGDNCYYDEANGIMRSLTEIHCVKVPMAELDRAKQYTICLRPLIERKPYFSETAELQEYSFIFNPVPEKDVRAYHIADAHNRIDEPVRAAQTFGKIDFLILNGDIISDSADSTKFHNIYEISSRITGGNIPVVFSRGNHDMRGGLAEKFADYTPNHLGNTYYTFRLGNIWGLVLDCGEDKLDENPEYGYTVCCTSFRHRQTEFIKNIISRCEEEYAAQGVTTRLVIAHNPFSQTYNPPFNAGEDIFSQWLSLIQKYIKPDLMICGHLHCLDVRYRGCEWDNLGQPCPVVIGSSIGENYFAGCGFVFNYCSSQIVFTDSDGAVLSQHIVQYKE